MFRTGIIVFASAIAVSGCLRSSYESTPVVVETPEGKVTCQLYTADRVQWDESIAKPDTMTRKEADEVCLAKGIELLNASRPR